MRKLLQCSMALVLAGLAPTANAHAKKVPTDDDEGAAFGRQVQAALRRNGADVHGCYAIALREVPTLSGEVLLRLWVQPDATVARVDVLKDQTGSRVLTDCLADAMRHWQLPELAGDDTRQVVFPLAFEPDDPGQLAAAQQSTYVVHVADGRPGPLPGNKIAARVLVTDKTVGKTQASLTRLDLAPSTTLAWHTHPSSVEVLYVLKGMARVEGNRERGTQEASPGDVIVIPAGAPHALHAAPLSSLELVQVFAPAGPERAYLDRGDRAAAALTRIVRAPRREKEDAHDEHDEGPQPMVIHGSGLEAHKILAAKGTAQLFLDGYFDKRVAFDRLEAEPGAVVPSHQHEVSDEVLYIVSGAGEMTVADRKIPVAAGDAVHIPMGVTHSLVVGEKLVAVQAYAPAGPEQRFRPPPPGTPQTGKPATPTEPRKP